MSTLAMSSILRLVVTLAASSVALSATDLRYWIEPCTRPETTCKADDPQLAQWALEAWQKASGGKLHLEKVADRQRAHIRVNWAAQNQGPGATFQFSIPAQAPA